MWVCWVNCWPAFWVDLDIETPVVRTGFVHGYLATGSGFRTAGPDGSIV